MFFSKKRPPQPTPYCDVLKTFGIEVNHLIGEALAQSPRSNLIQRDLADALERAAQNLRMSDALSRPLF